MARWGFAPFAVNAYDNPETIRMREYVTYARFGLRGQGSRRDDPPGRSSGRRARPGSTVTTRTSRSFAVPVLLVYALILRPYILDLVPTRIAHLQNVLNLCTSRSDRYRRQNRTTGGERSRDRSALGA
jgi:hypothetical protein